MRSRSEQKLEAAKCTKAHAKAEQKKQGIVQRLKTCD